MKMLSPEVNLRLIAPKRRNTGNPWFKRGTLSRAVIDSLRRSPVPMTTRQITDALDHRKGSLPKPWRQAANVSRRIRGSEASCSFEEVGQDYCGALKRKKPGSREAPGQSREASTETKNGLSRHTRRQEIPADR